MACPRSRSQSATGIGLNVRGSRRLLEQKPRGRPMAPVPVLYLGSLLMRTPGIYSIGPSNIAATVEVPSKTNPHTLLQTSQDSWQWFYDPSFHRPTNVLSVQKGVPWYHWERAKIPSPALGLGKAPRIPCRLLSGAGQGCQRLRPALSMSCQGKRFAWVSGNHEFPNRKLVEGPKTNWPSVGPELRGGMFWSVGMGSFCFGQRTWALFGPHLQSKRGDSPYAKRTRLPQIAACSLHQ